MTNQYLCAWLGSTDVRAAEGSDPAAGDGPIGRALAERGYDRVLLLSNFDPAKTERYRAWLSSRFPVDVRVETAALASPMDFSGIYLAAAAALNRVRAGDEGRNARLVFHISPGTSAMAAVWILLSKTLFPAELINSSPERGVETLSIPIAIEAEFITPVPEIEKAFTNLTSGTAPEAPEFDSIIHSCLAMQQAINEAYQYALFEVPVLLLGESGTGKELFARAVHRASRRAGSEFVAINCGAIPSELVESELFGYRKGAFTGASADKQGAFGRANGGTLFLDEIGELPLTVQVKLLRALQDGSIRPVGAAKEETADVRIIAATHRDLFGMVETEMFREDLFHRIAIGVVKLPPLRERKGDLFLLADHVMEAINRNFGADPSWKPKTVSAAGKAELGRYSWPGNIRELQNVLTRAAIRSRGTVITPEDVESAFLSRKNRESRESPLDRPLGNGFSLELLLEEVRLHYLARAVSESAGSKTKGAELLGFKNYQTYSNWLKGAGLE